MAECFFRSIWCQSGSKWVNNWTEIWKKGVGCEVCVILSVLFEMVWVPRDFKGEQVIHRHLTESGVGCPTAFLSNVCQIVCFF